MRGLLVFIIVVLAACARTPEQAALPPANETCALIAANKGWAKALALTAERWGVAPSTQLAIVRQESNFQVDRKAAQPLRPHGYAQADARTWAAYRRAAKRPEANRNDFADSVDFIGWYFSETNAQKGVAFNKVADHYLAYSRGWGAKGRPSQAARRNAARVVTYARAYEKDLAACPPR